jgi:hypothetical protein
MLDRFLEIENNEELYSYTFSYKKVMMYPFIRYYLLQSALEDSQGISSPYDSLHVGVKQKIVYVLKSFLYRPRNIQSDIVFFGTDLANICLKSAFFN